MLRKTLLSVVFALGVAGWVLAQTETRQSNSPTTSAYRLQILEPLEGATVTGPNVTIVMAKANVPQGSTAERKDALNPTFQVWVDGKDYGNLPIGQNVFTTSDLSYGPHTAVVAAKNTAGELVGRQELKFTTVERIASTTTSSETMSTTERTTLAPPPAPPAAVAAPPPAPEPAPVASEPEMTTADSPTLPATGTDYPLAALAGLGLVAAGLALRRRA